MKNKIKAILMTVAIGTMIFAATPQVQASQFEDGTEFFTDGSVSALATALAKQTEQQTQAFMAKEEEAAQIREERRLEKAQKASEKAEQEKTEVLESIQETVEDTRKKQEEEAAKKAEEERIAKRQEVVDFALQFEGNPYVYGGTSLTNGADCSGFVMSVFANFGYSLPRVAAAQCDASSKKDISQIEPGDLVFYGDYGIDHVALYIGDGKIVHASGAATGIKVSAYDYRQPTAIGTYME